MSQLPFPSRMDLPFSSLLLKIWDCFLGYLEVLLAKNIVRDRISLGKLCQTR